MPATTINVSSCIELVLANLAADEVEEAETLRGKIRHAEQTGETWLTTAEHALLVHLRGGANVATVERLQGEFEIKF